MIATDSTTCRDCGIPLGAVASHPNTGQCHPCYMTAVTAPAAPTLAPCNAGFDGCDAMRAEDVRKHPRTPRLRECRHYAIPPENPDRLQGPEVGSLCLYQGRNDPAPAVVRVVERSYVWSPGDRSQSRRYDLKVIDRGPKGRLLVDDKDLAPITAGMNLAPIPADHCVYCDKDYPRLAVRSHHHSEPFDATVPA